MNYITREMERKFLSMSSSFKAVMLTGARQVGKSTMLKHLAGEENRNYVTLDHLRNRQMAQSDPELFFQVFPPPVLIDEVQKAPELFEMIKILCDESEERGRFWLTGSESKRLLEKAGDSLSGRVCILHMYGLSYREKMGIYPKEQLEFSYHALTQRKRYFPKNNMVDIFEKIWRGSMPDVQNLDEEQWASYFESYIATYLMRDAVDDNGIKDTSGFLKFLRACAAVNGELLNYSELGAAAEVSIPTAKEWVKVLVNMGILYLLEPYANNALKRLVRKPKLYFCDTGLAAWLSMWTSAYALMNGAASGHFFENYIVMELVKYYATSAKHVNLTYYRDTNQKEVDVFVECDREIHPLEIKRAVNANKRDVKKFELLDKAALDRGCGGIFCMCEEPFPIDEKSSFIPGNII